MMDPFVPISFKLTLTVLFSIIEENLTSDIIYWWRVWTVLLRDIGTKMGT